MQTSVQSRGLSRIGYEEEIKKFTPKATRHIFLIRHGQYNTAGATDDERTLTGLGKIFYFHCKVCFSAMKLCVL